MARRLVAEPEVPLRRAAQIRVIYADTDRMGIVYHGTYLRYLEHARVEFIRGLGFAYSDLERMGVGLPVIDLAVTYLRPAEYDDIITVEVGLAKLSFARLHFVYRVSVQPGDRRDFDGPEPLVVLRAQTFHGCLDMQEHRATRLPESVHDILERYYLDARGDSTEGQEAT
ncbi:Acyl-CoA thioester hydrolase YbgC [Enhygromyxa salina]|uniref:Acyl-CoA thioester hydrolase YbgC n=1 Tax=Enhygromyxa salina TaxID=215803 RepID=A0A2S9YCM3_9BACT|nr:thioesterase family protein [Enhygromyxa salina]PRQ02867.1 Acyl-CoA thioester hydrolase YbgC [Enhygromyxa salina]